MDKVINDIINSYVADIVHDSLDYLNSGDKSDYTKTMTKNAWMQILSHISSSNLVAKPESSVGLDHLPSHITHQIEEGRPKF